MTFNPIIIKQKLGCVSSLLSQQDIDIIAKIETAMYKNVKCTRQIFTYDEWVRIGNKLVPLKILTLRRTLPQSVEIDYKEIELIREVLSSLVMAGRKIIIDYCSDGITCRPLSSIPMCVLLQIIKKYGSGTRK